MAQKITITVNGKEHALEVSPDMPVLWVLRDVLGLTGPKYGCGIGACGACTSHLDGAAFRPCITPAKEVVGRKIVTIEGLSANRSHPLQKAWMVEDVAQCGYCQPAQIMSAAALLAKNPKPSDAEIDEAMKDNVCRCGTYFRIRKAIKRAAKEL